MFPRSGGSLLINRIHLSTVPSTNSFARAEAASFDLKALTVITADEQTAGRGRGARTWVSSGADDIKLTFAFGVPRTRVANAYLLSPLLSIAAVRALKKTGITTAGVKWPNDIVMGGARKVGGVLCEMEGFSGGDFFVALGIGINVNSTPETLAVPRAQWPLTTLLSEARDNSGKVPIDIKLLTETLVSEFAAVLPTFSENGWTSFREEYARASVLLGRRITFAVDAPGSSEKKMASGIAEAFADDGSLLLRNAEGEIQSFLAGEVAGIMLDEEEVAGDTAF
jgi:BirA family biotin operon repressor/biotin-[acetyl-CoA-carboxylase] ligase